MTKKIGYLTIDDAPTDDFRNKVDFLFQNNIPAIFFCEGRKLEQRPEEIIYAIKKGFVIGNHSYNHPHFSSISLTEAKEQIKKTDEIIDEIYKKSGIQRPTKVFRFPGLNKGEGNNYENFNWDKPRVIELQTFLKNLGYTRPKFENINYKWWEKAGLKKNIDVDCSFDTMDWTVADGSHKYEIKDLQGMYDRMDEDYPEEHRGLNFNGSNEIIMMHDSPNIADMFQPLIKRLIEKGIKFELPKF
jgi:peptidoglycan-N-acetylglucosamine deacetylase